MKKQQFFIYLNMLVLLVYHQTNKRLDINSKLTPIDIATAKQSMRHN
jgi:hypothetical protein